MPYNTVNRRVRALEEHGYVEKTEKEKQKDSALYSPISGLANDIHKP